MSAAADCVAEGIVCFQGRPRGQIDAQCCCELLRCQSCRIQGLNKKTSPCRSCNSHTEIKIEYPSIASTLTESLAKYGNSGCRAGYQAGCAASTASNESGQWVVCGLKSSHIMAELRWHAVAESQRGILDSWNTKRKQM